jgi:nitrogen regulatory protein P-II 1
MIKIEAIIRPHMVEAVQNAVEEFGHHGLTVTEVKGMGKQKGATHTYRGSTYTLNLHHKVKIEMVVEDEHVEEILSAIRSVASTGEIGDGKIFLIPVSDAIRIRTGERGDAALS